MEPTPDADEEEEGEEKDEDKDEEERKKIQIYLWHISIGINVVRQKPWRQGQTTEKFMTPHMQSRVKKIWKRFVTALFSNMLLL